MRIEAMPITSGNYWTTYIDRIAIVNHIMEGGIPGSFARFNNPKEQVSSHFGVGLDGRIVQFVNMNCSAWANGILEEGYDSTIPWLVECATKNINPNKRTISIEHAGYSGDKMPESQYQATVWLHKQIILAYPTIVPSRKSIIGHNQITPKGKPFCPGLGFPFNRLIEDLQEGFADMSGNTVPGGYHVRKEFTDFWFYHGGLQIFGFPIGDEQPALAKYGKAVAIQYFERARFELQPDGTVLLGLVGNEAISYRGYRGTL